MDAMVANCAQLRQSLVHLQSQLNVLTTNKNGTKEEQPKTEKQKKPKSKKSKGEKQIQKPDVEKIDPTKESEHSVEVLSSGKGNTSEIEEQQVVTGNLNEATAGTTVDEKTVENLIQAINMANVNLCSLENVSYETNEILNETTNEVVKEEQLEIVKDEQHEIVKDEQLEIVKDEIIELTKDESSENAQNTSSENIKELNGISPISIIPNPQVETSHIPEAKSKSNEIP